MGCETGKTLQGNGSWMSVEMKKSMTGASASAIALQCNIKCKASGNHANEIKG